MIKPEKLTIDEIAERLRARPTLYLHCAAVDRAFDEKPKAIPTLAVLRVHPFDYTATCDREGASVPPPGRDWREFGRHGESTFYRRMNAHVYFADEVANVSIKVRRPNGHEWDVLDAVVRTLPDRVRKFLDRVFLDNKHGEVTLEINVADVAIARCIGELFAAGGEEIGRGYSVVSVTAGGGRDIYRVTPHWS